MRWIVLVTVLALLVTSAPLWAQSVTVPVQANVLALLELVNQGFRGTPEPVRLALLGGALVTGSVTLRRRRGEDSNEEGGD